MKNFNISKRLFAVIVPIMIIGTGCHYHETPVPTPPPCHYGYDGLPGDAFFGIDWVDVAPDYLWTDNPAIPAIFRYGSFYGSPTGTYELYYEGEYIEECCPVYYYWDVIFDVWRNPGTYGGCGYNGLHGADSYLMIYTGPYGPYDTRVNKVGGTSAKFKVISDTGDQIIIEQVSEEVVMRVTYKKREKKAARRI